MKIHYYMLGYRFEALVASHLEPEAFGHYMAVGTKKLSHGNVVYFEIDSNLKSSYFHLNNIEQRCVPKPDGGPKRSKYISVYRVLEHLDLSVIGNLYLATSDGRVLCLESTPYDTNKEPSGINLYQELCPLPPQVVSELPPGAFCKFMTDPANPISVPRLFFADQLLDRDESGNLAGYLPYTHPLHILDWIKELERVHDKPTRTVSRTPEMNAFFRTIRRGFFVGDQKGLKFYRFPELRDLEVQYSRWWRSASSH